LTVKRSVLKYVRLFSFLIDFFNGPKVPLHRVERIFFGIGNPGSQYADTRHNVGFAVLDSIASSLKNISKYRGGSWNMLIGSREGIVIALVKPTTFVNLSGKAFSDVLAKTGLSLHCCVVIVDDYHLPLGAIRLRPKGSDGGHNGLKSIIERSGEGFARLRVGIGPLPAGMPSVEFVLGKFTPQEIPAVAETLQKSEEALMHIAVQGIDSAMNRFNK